ncbi:MAG: PIG-L deacetylase family protein [Candidatus Latescibacterota bacterium]
MSRRPIHIVLVAAHPADSFDQAGGTLAHHVDRGDRVTVLIATTGVRSHHSRLQEEKRQGGAEFDIEARIKEAAVEKLEEVRNACRILGFDEVRDLGFEDDDVLLTQDKIDAIAEEIRELKPDILIAEHPYEIAGHCMHATVGQATLQAWQIATGVGRGRQVRHYVPSLFFMNPMAWTGNNSLGYAGTARVDLYVDISDVIEKKVQAVDYITSQYYGGPYSRKRAEIEDGAYGNKSYTAYAEQFQSFFPLVRYTLPITQAELDRIDESSETTLARRSDMAGGLLPLPPNMAFTTEHRIPKDKYVEE